LAGLFVQVLRLCQAAGLVKLGHVALDGTKVKANASKHKAMSYARMKQTEQRLEQEVQERSARAGSPVGARPAARASEHRDSGAPAHRIDGRVARRWWNSATSISPARSMYVITRDNMSGGRSFMEVLTVS
jgi:hypothetical protein